MGRRKRRRVDPTDDWQQLELLCVWEEQREYERIRPLALLVAVLDLVPLVGATLGGALLVIVGLFVEPWKAVVLLIFVLVYQQVESNFLQPMVYSQAVQLNGLVILIALLVGGQLLGIPGALLAIPVAEIIRIVISEILAYRRTTRLADAPPVTPSSPTTASG